jgi:hypothetical protein
MIKRERTSASELEFIATLAKNCISRLTEDGCSSAWHETKNTRTESRQNLAFL